MTDISGDPGLDVLLSPSAAATFAATTSIRITYARVGAHTHPCYALYKFFAAQYITYAAHTYLTPNELSLYAGDVKCAI